MICSVLPPRRRPFHSHYDGGPTLEGCDLPIGHNGPHRALADGIWYEWQSEDDCGCCDVTDPDRCFWFTEVGE